MKWRIMLRIAGMQKYWPHMDGLKLSDVLIDQHLIWETILTLQASIYKLCFARFVLVSQIVLQNIHTILPQFYRNQIMRREETSGA